MFRTYGIRDCLLLSVIRDTFEIPDEASDPIKLGCSYGRSYSVLEEIISNLDHVNPLNKSNNDSVYSMMEEASRGNVYAPTINPYARNKNGRAAWKAMVSSCTVQDKW